MNIYSRDNNLILTDVRDFDIEDILECGQCFHYSRLGDHEYELLAYGRYLRIRQITEVNCAGDEDGICEKPGMIVLYDTGRDEYEAVWRRYFDMDTNYGIIKEGIVCADERLAEAVYAKAGIRILRQDFFETLISFIISQNKQIPHIRQIVRLLSEQYGSTIALQNGRSVHAFPTPEQLYPVSDGELRQCKVGFRAPYIRDAVEKVCNGEVSADKLMGMSVDEARKQLLSIKGVGEKVANCVLLFGLGFTHSFPVDVWIKRIMEAMYFNGNTKKEIIEQFGYEQFGEYAGYAQQYLFHYGREHGLGKKEKSEKTSGY